MSLSPGWMAKPCWGSWWDEQRPAGARVQPQDVLVGSGAVTQPEACAGATGRAQARGSICGGMRSVKTPQEDTRR